MKKRGNLSSYIREQIRKGHSKVAIKYQLERYGYNPEYIDKEFSKIKNNNIVYGMIIVIAVLGMLFSFKPSLTGMVVSDDSYPAVKFASADFNKDVGLVYQGVGSDGLEHIYRDKSELSLQGKQKGSVNIIDYDNDGDGDLFTTGFYSSNNEEVAATNLYQDLSSGVGSFTNVKNSDSCWADFDNDGDIEPAIIGSTAEFDKVFEVYGNDGGNFEVKQSFTGIDTGSIECVDYDNDGWTDVIVCGREEGTTGVTKTFRNNEGNLQLDNSYGTMADCRLTINDFDNDKSIDFVVSGRTSTYDISIYENSGGDFSSTSLSNTFYTGHVGLTSGDTNNDGLADFALSGEDIDGNSNDIFFTNNGNSFSETNEYLQLDDGEILFLNKDNSDLDLFQTGTQDNNLISQLVMDLGSGNNKPSAPVGLNYSLENELLKLTWQPSTDDHTQHLFYHVRAGTDANPNQFLSGFLYDEKGNAGLADFKLLKDPGQCFFFQVKAIDGAYAESDWSEKFKINCEENIVPIINETMEINNTVQDNIIEENETIEILEEKRWVKDRNFDNIKYHAEYEIMDNYILITEIITNKDTYSRKNVNIYHPTRFSLIDAGGYKISADRSLNYNINIMEPGDKRIIALKVRNAEQGQVYATQINSERIVPEESAIREVNISEVIIVDKEENKTTIPIEVKVNGSNLAEEGVTVKQTLPKCLIEKINELAIASGQVKASKEFEIVDEDPVIMWHFESIVDPELLQLEIANVADENCTNKIITEIVAKKVLIQKDELKPMNALILFFSVLLILIGIYLFVKRSEEMHRRVALIVFASAFILLNIFDALSMLPESLDFIKKVFSWVLMVALLYHVSLDKTLFSGKEKTKPWFNILLLFSFILLSIKNIVYVAFKTYGKERLFSDMLLPIIKYSKELETYLFFSGAIILSLLTLYVIKKMELSSPSFASLIHKTEYEFIGNPLKKPLFVFFIFLGFYIAFFNFLFGWFSIAFDGPFLVLAVIVTIYIMATRKKHEDLDKMAGKTDTFIEKFIKLFTHDKNVFIAFSAFPAFIFIVETYNYLAYMLFGIRSIYFESLPFEMPTIFTLSLEGVAIPLYIVQILALISGMILAFLFWWHFFLQREKEGENYLRDRPKHPFLFSVFITGMAAFLIRPVFDFSIVKAKVISGSILFLKSIAADHLMIIYVILSIIFVMSYLAFRDIKKANILPYSIMMVTLTAFTGSFIISFFRTLKIGKIGISIDGFNSIFLLLAALSYGMILAFSIYALIGEFLSLVREEFYGNRIYRKVISVIFPHKTHVPEQHKQQIKEHMEKLLDEGEEEYLVIEQIHKRSNLPVKEITDILHELEEDDEQKERYHQIKHYHHNIKEIKKLHKHIKKQYEKGMDAESIIDGCLNQGWSQDDIAGAMMHIRYKKQDKELFEAIRKVDL